MHSPVISLTRITGRSLVGRFLLALILAGAAASPAAAQTTAFTYQGRLTDNSAAANGNYDMVFVLYTSATGSVTSGAQAVTVNPLVVTTGLFTVSLDFGASALPGADRWLEISLRPSGSTGAYTTLAPRQKLTPAPYAIRAASAGTSAALTGNISAAQVTSGTLNTALISDGTLAASKLATTIGVLNRSGNDLNFTAGNVGIGTASPEHRLDVDGNLGVRGSLVVDSKNQNNGTDIPGIIFGDYNSVEVISCQRGPTGPNRYGFDFYTGGVRRMSIANNGRVGIGTATPQAHLDITNNSTGGTWLNLTNSSTLEATTWNLISTGPGNSEGVGKLLIRDNDNNAVRMTVDSNGFVGIGTTSPAAPLDINLGGGGRFQIRNDGPTPAINLTGGGAPGVLRIRNALEVVANDAGTAGGKLDVRNIGGGATIILDGESGDASVKTLTITGGSDLAEPFDLTDTALEAGTVVVIDDAMPGRLAESSRAYDECVAGIISGAGGINPGISLQQDGVNSGGRKVALTGRVYVRAEADSGPIKPGDLLTTSSVSGHAMKARDSKRRNGAVLGKAMSRLDKGRGLVLVLVTLQ